MYDIDSNQNHKHWIVYLCNIRFEFISLKLQLCIAEVLYILSCRVIQCAILIFFYQKGFIVYNYIIMGTQRRNYKHGDQKHLHRSIMAITSGPKYLKHKNIYFINI